MKIKFLKTVTTALGFFIEEEIHDLELDKHTLDSWIESELIEKVESSKKKKVVDSNED